MEIRKATAADLAAVDAIYGEIHDAEERGAATVGWKRGVYPIAETAEAALSRGDLFVQEDGGKIVGTGIINQLQLDEYRDAAWLYAAEDREVMVLHTLVISPRAAGKGYGRAFAEFYGEYARGHGCRVLRIDTNEKNAAARALYRKLGYREADVTPCVFNGIGGVRLVLLEKRI